MILLAIGLGLLALWQVIACWPGEDTFSGGSRAARVKNKETL